MGKARPADSRDTKNTGQAGGRRLEERVLTPAVVTAAVLLALPGTVLAAEAAADPRPAREASPAAPAGGALQATPQRPSLSFNAATVPAGAFEMEWGGLVAEQAGSVPAFLKYGFTRWLEGELGFDVLRQVDAGGAEITSRGDVVAGVRARPAVAWEGPALAGVAWVKAPTARDGAGSGETDVGVIGIASGGLGGGLWLDLNVGWAALGTPRGGTLGQVQAISTVGLPVKAPWSVFVEGAWQKTASSGDGLFLDAGLGYAASPRAVFDAAAGVGSSRGYPDWTVTIGWTILVRPGR